jgi:predicted RNA-binding Zn-ribbon protein involved in translation (DUF1610 family)
MVKTARTKGEKVLSAKAASIQVKKVEIPAAPAVKVVQKKGKIAEAKVVVPHAKECTSCGHIYEGSGIKYCPSCAAAKAKASRKQAQKNRKANRKQELIELREIMVVIRDILSDKSHTDKGKLTSISNTLSPK